MESFLPFINREQCCKIWLNDIMYIRQEGRMTSIVTEKETYCSYEKLKDMEAHLDKRFYYCLKKVIINFENVAVMKEQTIYFKNGDFITLGRQNYVHTRQAFAAYLLQQKKNEKEMEKSRPKSRTK